MRGCSVADKLKNFYDVGAAPRLSDLQFHGRGLGHPLEVSKQIASHFGGTRQGMAISWPALKDLGRHSTQSIM